MLTQQTLDKLYDMKLTAMAEAFSQQMGQPDLGELSFEDLLGHQVICFTNKDNVVNPACIVIFHHTRRGSISFK